MDKVVCYNCKGKGHVLDAIALFNPFTALLALGERNDKNGSTRDKCSHCKGKGYVIWK